MTRHGLYSVTHLPTSPHQLVRVNDLQDEKQSEEIFLKGRGLGEWVGGWVEERHAVVHRMRRIIEKRFHKSFPAYAFCQMEIDPITRGLGLGGGG